MLPVLELPQVIRLSRQHMHALSWASQCSAACSLSESAGLCRTH